MQNPFSLIACPHNRCLYLCDYGLDDIHRVELSELSFSFWSVDGGPRGLSLSPNNHLIVTLLYANSVREYTTHGILLREISLDAVTAKTYHAVELHSGQFVGSSVTFLNNFGCCQWTQTDKSFSPIAEFQDQLLGGYAPHIAWLWTRMTACCLLVVLASLWVFKYWVQCWLISVTLAFLHMSTAPHGLYIWMCSVVDFMLVNDVVVASLFSVRLSDCSELKDVGHRVSTWDAFGVGLLIKLSEKLTAN